MSSSAPPIPTHNEVDERAQTILAWDRCLDDLDYFTLLAIPENATALDVDSAFYRFARHFHPDSNPEYTAQVQGALTRIFQRGVEARRVLMDPRLNADYRRQRLRGSKRLTEERADLPELDLWLPRLHERCRSAGAKLEAAAAARAWQKRDITSTRTRLLAALQYDGGANSDLARTLAQLEPLE